MLKRKRVKVTQIKNIPLIKEIKIKEIVIDDGVKDTVFERFDDNVSAELDILIASSLEKKPFITTTCQTTLLQTTSTTIDIPFTTLSNANVTPRLVKSFIKQNTLHTTPPTTDTQELTPLQASLFQHFSTYKDTLYTSQTQQTLTLTRNTYLLHALNHIYKSRDLILKNNLEMKRKEILGESVGEVRDQGFTRPRVLILCPFKNDALKIITTLITLSATNSQENISRFQQEFGEEDADDTVHNNKPQDYKELFEGNLDDCFRIGIKFSGKNMKLYSDFYSSDILICSPLGLRMIIGDPSDKKRDYDFLSSLEIVILDKTNVFLMQNWDHVEHLFDHLNLIPKHKNDTDFSRVKAWHLDGKSSFLRQTICCSAYTTPQVNSLFGRGKNVAGKVRVKSMVDRGRLEKVCGGIPQLFQRIECDNAYESSDSRFAYFCNTFLASLGKMKQTLLFIPSYFDYIRVRNYMTSQRYAFLGLSEYSTNVDVSRARLQFFKGEVPILIVTERFHFFKRYVMRGARHVVFYQVPENGHFYDEIVNCVDVEAAEKHGEASSVSLFWNTFDGIALERVVGKERVGKLFEMKKRSFVFTC